MMDKGKYSLTIRYELEHCLDYENYEFTNVEEFKGAIYLDTYNDDEEDELVDVKIGELELHLYSYVPDRTIYQSFDRSANTIEIGDIILDPDTDCIKEEITDKIGESLDTRILVIHHMKLYKQYRCMGFGEEIMKGIEYYFYGKCGYLALKSFPLQYEKIKHDPAYEYETDKTTYRKDQASLNRFYKKCGFTKVNKAYNIYVKNVAPMFEFS